MPAKLSALVRIGVCGTSLAFVFLVLVSNAGSQQTADEARKPVVLVPPFENQSKYHVNVGYEVATGNDPNQPKRHFTVDRYTEAPRSLFEDMLGNIEGVTIVERQRVDALLAESEFGRLSGLVDTEKALKLGKMLGANVIIMGTIVDIRDEKRDFKGYGIQTKNTEVICQIRVRMLDIEKGTVRFTKIVKGSKTYTESSFGGTSSSDRNFAAIEVTLQQLESDSQFRKALLGGKAGATAENSDGLVEVEFAPKPENSDIEIDGKYVGGSPLKRRMPAAKEVKVRISKGGYESWTGVIVPEAGLRITRELGRSH